jgi:PAP2 superfamily
MLAARANDGRNPTTPFPFVLGTTPGVWSLGPQRLTPTSAPGQPIDPTPWVGNVTPFLVPSAEMLRTKGPNALTSRKYAKEFDEVKSLGSLTSTARTPDQTMAAIFWQAQPTALYSGAMRQLSSKFALDTAQNARLFGMVGLSAADGAIGCWNDKYFWNFWRPINAIRAGNEDGNPATIGDPNWLPLFDPATQTVPALVSPGFPDHPSGHSCVSGAILHAMRNFFHTDKAEYTVTSPRFPGQPRSFTSFSQNLQEIVDARVWGGIHWRTADEQGAKLGKKVARFERAHFFKAVGEADDDDGDDDD